jgi:hypothetical protein
MEAPAAAPQPCAFQDKRLKVPVNCGALNAIFSQEFGWRCEHHHQSERLRAQQARRRARVVPQEDDVEPPRAHVAQAPPRPRPETLAAFAADKQNVHTKATVDLVRKTVDHVLKIPVPDEYQTDTLKTVGEIILDCRLSKKAASQMTVRYCSDDSIYQYGPGIYARLLNSVWQFIKGSEHKTDLCAILRSEMEDNIDMCAQGNLSRLCNILSGYMESLVVETPAEQLQRRMAKIAASDRKTHMKTIQALRLLQELTIPSQEWGAWLEPLMD